MPIAGIVFSRAMTSECYALEAYPFETFLEEMYSFTSVALVVQVATKDYRYVDIRKMYSEEPMTIKDENGEDQKITSWDMLEQYISGLDTDILNRFVIKIIVPRLMKLDDTTSIPTPFYSTLDTQLKIVGAENSVGINFSYGDHKEPYENNHKSQSWNSPDLRIYQDRKVVDMDNCIPIINGSVFYPEVWTNPVNNEREMFAVQAGKWLMHCNWNQNNSVTVPHSRVPEAGSPRTFKDRYTGGDSAMEHAVHYNKGVVMLDFSPIGDIEVIKLSDCLNGVIEGSEIVTENKPKLDPKKHPHQSWLKGPLQQRTSSRYTINFTLPKGTAFGIPIVCICGRLFFLNEHVRMHDDGENINLSVSIENRLISNIMLSNLQWYGKQIPDTHFVEAVIETTFNELFQDTEYGYGSVEDVERWLHEDLSVPFVIMLRAKKTTVMHRTDPLMSIKPDKILFPKYAGGLLINKRTKEIIDYARIPYTRGTLVETCMHRPLNAMLNEDFHKAVDPDLAFEWINYNGKSKYLKFNRHQELRNLENFELVDFAYLEVE